MPSWTLEQKDAIDSEGQNIIVSAGAGSGKTAVLTERVIRKLKSGVHIDELLVLTFTKAAAAEMKTRIREAISENDSLKGELDRIDNSYITTFDSYALSVVKKYHYLLNISKNVSIIDSSVIYLKKKEMLDKIFLDLYKEKDPNFLKLIGDFCLKSDDEIKKYILSINNKLDLKYDKDLYLDNYVDKFYNNEKISDDIGLFLNLCLKKIDGINKNLTLLSNYVDTDYFNKVKKSLEELVNATNYNEVINNLEIKLPNLPRNTEEEAKVIKSNISDVIKEIKELCKYSSEEKIISSIYKTKSYVEAIIKVIKLLDEEISNYKYLNDVYEFVDISKLAIRVLKEHPSACSEVSKSFNEIMVDEYQDTNDLQEEFVSMINNNNCYMVGDIKQSIYRFRNANPYIFKEKYDNYSCGNNGKKIDLTKNFRSREEVLFDINVIFDLIMSDDIGGANYKKSHRMVFGNNDYNTIGKTNQNNNLEIYSYLYDNKYYTKAEIEAFIIAKDIQNKINSGYKVFDKKKKVLRDITYDDFVILIDRTTNFDLYKKIFEYLNIPLMKYTDTSITNEVDLLLIKNIIKFIIKVSKKEFDSEFKRSFLSIGRSYLFRFSDEELFECFSNNNFKENEIYRKSSEIVELINSKSSAEILELIIKKFDFYEKIITIGGVEEGLIRINYLIDVASTLGDLGYNLESFLNYIEDLINSKYDIKLSYGSSASNLVKIMTIHASKGLEYHVCYFPGLYSKFNISDLKDKMLFDNKYGIITPYLDNNISDTIYKDLMKDKYKKEELSEKIRLFYVGVTRAKEKMIMLKPYKEDESSKPLTSAMSFLDIINTIDDKLAPYKKEIDINNINLSKDYNLAQKSSNFSMIAESDKRIDYYNLDLMNVEVPHEKFSKDNSSIISKEEKEKMEIGTRVHYLLESLDFKNPSIDKLDIDKYLKEKLDMFFNIALDFTDSKVYKEYNFTYIDGNIEKSGIIDLMLEDNEEIKIIDYKLKNTSDSNYKKQVLGYKKYIKEKTNKKVRCYLYSIIDGVLEEIVDEE